jgi:two-component system CheB/CheR fusion protein
LTSALPGGLTVLAGRNARKHTYRPFEALMQDITPPTAASSRADRFGGPLVAIGASAGGLDALERLFQALPASTGAAFVVVQHLSADHRSMMDTLLARHTAMPIKVAQQDQPLHADTVFLIPPGKTMTLAGDRLQLAPRPEHQLTLPIDIFFASAAEAFGDRTIAVVLSGTGSDGTRGIVAINAAGGFVFAQAPDSAKFDGMPRSAIAGGLVDVIAPASALAERIVAQLRTPRGEPARWLAAHPPESLSAPLDGILQRLHVGSGIDFKEYKPTTVLRRIERRMQVLRSPSLAGYLAHLSDSLEEQASLRRELLIPVTRFFRDPEAFDALAAEVIAPMVARHESPEPLRVWVAACATGEEAYSIAILFFEAFQRHGRRPALKIFATDVEAQYLDVGAAGWYPGTVAAELAPARLERHFAVRGGGFVVRPELRQRVVFARHNLLVDPPFTRMDLVVCRNLLIYLLPPAQERVLRRLQYALAPGGAMMLGPSESLGDSPRDCQLLHARHKLYRLVRKERLAGSLAAATPERAAALRVQRPVVSSMPERPVDAGARLLAQHYVPPTLLVGPQRALLHVYGDLRGLLQIAEGQPTLDVLKLLPRELSWAAALVLQAVQAQGGVQRSPPLKLTDAAGERYLQIVARRLGGSMSGGGAGSGTDGESCQELLLTFEAHAQERPTPADAVVIGAAEGRDQRAQIEALERELGRTHDSLRATIEELGTANEELQATNEELMASNEELQSTNEELQSVNEELYTVNSEYQQKVDVLNSVNADLENVSRAAAVPTIFVDDGLHVTRFTPEAVQLFKLRDSDIGRSLEDFSTTLDYPDLFGDLRRTLASSQPIEREVKSRDGRWWLARLRPYADRAQALPRAVMTFVEVTTVKDHQRLQAIIDSLAQHLAVIDASGRIALVNEGWRRFALANGDAGALASGPGIDYLEVCARAAAHDTDAARAHAGLIAVLAGQQARFVMQYPCHSPTQRRWFLMHASPIAHAAGGAVVSHADITEWVEGREGAGGLP